MGGRLAVVYSTSVIKRLKGWHFQRKKKKERLKGLGCGERQGAKFGYKVVALGNVRDTQGFNALDKLKRDKALVSLLGKYCKIEPDSYETKKYVKVKPPMTTKI